jgi:tRNA pseudouridine55 synthase
VIDGLVVVDKPAGMTSHDVVARCRRIFGQRKVGHSGTLDPDATGVLVVGLGRATRLLQFHTGLSKRYEAEIVLGVATTTLDAAGEVAARWDQRHVTLDDTRRAAAQLTGDIWQVPPMVSAVKVGGRRLHQLAREGVEVERAPRPVRVTDFSVDTWRPLDEEHGAGPVVGVVVECSSGTYVRVLAADLGAALGGGAHVRRLRRTAVGPWSAAGAVELDALSAADVIAPVDSLPWLDEWRVDERRAVEVGNGRVVAREQVAATTGGPWRVIGPGGDLIAVYDQHGSSAAKPVLVLPPPEPGLVGSTQPGAGP